MVRERGGVEEIRAAHQSQKTTECGAFACGEIVQLASQAAAGSTATDITQLGNSHPRRHHHKEVIYVATGKFGRKVDSSAPEAALADGESFGASVPAFVPELSAPKIPGTPIIVPAHQPRRAWSDDHPARTFPDQDTRPISCNSAVRVGRGKSRQDGWAIRWGADTVMDSPSGEHPHHAGMDLRMRRFRRTSITSAGEVRWRSVN